MADFTGRSKPIAYLFQNGGGGGGGSSTLDGLSDVNLTTPTDGQVLAYDANADEWVNSNLEEIMMPLIYSTEEREVGCWVDGKPLYAKTVEYSDISFPNGTTGGARSFTKDFPAGNIENVIFLNVNATPASVYVHVQYERTSAKQITINDITKTATYVRLHSLTIPADIVYGGVGTTYVTLYYTKSTDTAGSGHWTSAGAAHHYSMNEQVVGTWIDGKPIYEKTISWNNTRVEATSYTHGISDLEKCINSEAFLHDPDNDRTYILPFYGNDGILLVREVNQTYVILGGTNYFNASANRTFYVTLRYTKTTD